ncbi:MAG: hypothetical protein LAT62_02320 [Natronospirillum sp.]|uniref:Rho termination factor N-terminal domain-containing protein n=1 Tax=Natronospirillum sp. TaxID=2812955 RepID=UPI0025FAA286|nr:Rho termination factor N-terminal domain-containing protein [Natronospirillum sp.]MCH8550742.1 hypothetical protein [Natronospirillum sp.]
MTQLSSASLEWLWDFDKQKPHIRHWPAVTQGAVHIHDVSDLSELRRAAASVRDVDEWTDTWRRLMPAEQISVAVDTLADMIDHNRENCLGEAANLKGFSESIFALARGEILTTLPFPARLALLSDGLANIETSGHDHDVRESLQELTVSDLQTLAKQSERIPQRLRKAELIDALVAAEDNGEIELPLGDISPAPPLHGWLEGLIQQYVRTLKVSLDHSVYPRRFKEAVWRQAIDQASIDALRRALELEYWAVLSAEIEDTEPEEGAEEPEDNATLRAEPRPAVGAWEPAVARDDRDAAVMWLAVALLVLGWLFF